MESRSRLFAAAVRLRSAVDLQQVVAFGYRARNAPAEHSHQSTESTDE
jgi:hypothetical protein